MKRLFFNLGALLLLVSCLYVADRFAGDYYLRILTQVAIFVTLAVSYNLVVGISGQLHLGPNAFITIGAYTAALLTLTPADKELIFLMKPLVWPLSQVSLPFVWSLLAGGLVAAGFGFLTGFPVFRVRGDYLAIVTLASAKWCGCWPTTSRA